MIDSVYLLATTVAGRQFYDADDAWPYLSVGTTLAMRYEPENSHDRFAVSLWYEAEDKQYKLGYIPRGYNEFVAVMFMMGWGHAFRCIVSRLDGAAPYDSQIGVTVKVLNRGSVTT